MKRKMYPSMQKSSDRSREDIERIHTMLRVAIVHIEKKAQCIIHSNPQEQNTEALDEVLSGLTKITALISKIIPIEKEMENEGHVSQDSAILEEAIDWDMLERYFKKKNVPAQ